MGFSEKNVFDAGVIWPHHFFPKKTLLRVWGSDREFATFENFAVPPDSCNGGKEKDFPHAGPNVFGPHPKMVQLRFVFINYQSVKPNELPVIFGYEGLDGGLGTQAR